MNRSNAGALCCKHYYYQEIYSELLDEISDCCENYNIVTPKNRKIYRLTFRRNSERNSYNT